MIQKHLQRPPMTMVTKHFLGRSGTGPPTGLLPHLNVALEHTTSDAKIDLTLRVRDSTSISASRRHVIPKTPFRGHQWSW